MWLQMDSTSRTTDVVGTVRSIFSTRQQRPQCPTPSPPQHTFKLGHYALTVDESEVGIQLKWLLVLSFTGVVVFNINTASEKTLKL